MNVPSNLLSIFSKMNGSPDLADSALAVPSLLQPVVQIPAVLTNVTNGFNALLALRTSFLASQSFTLTNGGANQFNIVTFGEGLWDITLDWFYNVNFANVNAVQLQAQDTQTTGIMNLAIFTPLAANVIVTKTQKFVVSLLNPLVLDVQMPLSGVGQTQVFSIMVLGNRLA